MCWCTQQASITPEHHSASPQQQQQPMWPRCKTGRIHNLFTTASQMLHIKISLTVIWHFHIFSQSQGNAILGLYFIFAANYFSVNSWPVQCLMGDSALYAVHLISIMYATSPSKAAMLIPVKGHRSRNRTNLHSYTWKKTNVSTFRQKGIQSATIGSE